MEADEKTDKSSPERDSQGWPMPSKTLGYRLFRFSWQFILISSSTGAIVSLLWSKERIGKAFEPITIPFSVLYGACFVYFISYLASTVVKNPVVRALWIFLLFVLALLGGCTVLPTLVGSPLLSNRPAFAFISMIAAFPCPCYAFCPS